MGLTTTTDIKSGIWSVVWWVKENRMRERGLGKGTSVQGGKAVVRKTRWGFF